MAKFSINRINNYIIIKKLYILFFFIKNIIKIINFKSIIFK